MSARPVVHLVPVGDPQAYRDLLLLRTSDKLGDVLASAPALTLEPVDGLLDRPLRQLRVEIMAVDPGTPLYWPRCVVLGPAAKAAEATAGGGPKGSPTEGQGETARGPQQGPRASTDGHPDALSEDQAVRLTYASEIDRIASFLHVGLSVLVSSDKLVVRHMWPAIALAARLEPLVLDVPADEGGGLVPRSQRQRQLARLRELLTNVKDGQVIVLPHLDLLGGGGERGLAAESREITELLYEEPDRPLLAFADRSLPLPEVMAARFAVRPELAGLPRDVAINAEDRLPLGVALVTAKERALFSDYKPAELFKQVAGMNPVRLRHALAYAVEIAAGHGHSVDKPAPVGLLYESIRAFKAQTSEQFAVPDVTWTDIGGYEEVKALLQRALDVMAGAFNLPNEALRRELIPRGFLLYGPPGTGKTLFAKAVANQLNATIRVVSGPEVTDMYVGESERKLRAIFAEARRNAPSVVVFDEFDSIAASRSARDDGGSRAGNALVAQILTEMDGFRPDVPMLVIGTTNRLNLIDEALLRPSRFQPISVGLPDEVARRRIAEVHAAHFRVEVDREILDVLADATHGFNGDQIRSLFRDACVGAYCDRPQQPVTPERIGFLVGRLRAAADQQRLESPDKAQVPATATAPVGPGLRRLPSAPMMPIGGGDRRPGSRPAVVAAQPSTAESEPEGGAP